MQVKARFKCKSKCRFPNPMAARSFMTNKFISTTLFFTFIQVAVFAQSDSAQNDNSGLYNALRFGIVVERSPYIEAGFSKLGISNKGLESGSFCFYGAGELNLSHAMGRPTYIYGGKVGFETAWMIGMWAVELKYLTNGIDAQLYFTPKVGLSALGFMSILYGYNTPRKDNLKEVGTHQISITINYSRQLLHSGLF